MEKSILKPVGFIEVTALTILLDSLLEKIGKGHNIAAFLKDLWRIYLSLSKGLEASSLD
jgi:hypothetical protein